MDGLLKKYSKIIAYCAVFIFFVVGGVFIYRTFGTQEQKAYVAPPSLIIDPTKIPYEIKGNVITLKRLGYEHLEGYHAMFSDDTRFSFRFWKSADYAKTQNYVYNLISRMNDGEIMAYGIFDNADNCFIGQIEVRSLHEDDPGQIGSWLNENYRGKGRIQEAIKLLLKAYFEISGQTRVNTYVETFNKRSYRAFQKAGFKQAGRAFMYNKKFNILDIEKDNPVFTNN